MLIRITSPALYLKKIKLFIYNMHSFPLGLDLGSDPEQFEKSKPNTEKNIIHSGSAILKNRRQLAIAPGKILME
jgi:hypothetical protein